MLDGLAVGGVVSSRVGVGMGRDCVQRERGGVVVVGAGQRGFRQGIRHDSMLMYKNAIIQKCGMEN